MDEETRAAFRRMDKYFELGQAQHQELRTELRAEMHELRTEMQAGFADIRGEMRGGSAALRTDFNALRDEFRAFRDWATLQFASVRTAIQRLEAPPNDRSW